MQADIRDGSALRTISRLRQIIGFRNVLVYGYAAIQPATVWGLLENDLLLLKREVQMLLANTDSR